MSEDKEKNARVALYLALMLITLIFVSGVSL